MNRYPNKLKSVPRSAINVQRSAFESVVSKASRFTLIVPTPELRRQKIERRTLNALSDEITQVLQLDGQIDVVDDDVVRYLENDGREVQNCLNPSIH
jgi:hypothetical protein